MLYKVLVFFAILADFLLFSRGGVIHDRKVDLDHAKGAPKIHDRITNGTVKVQETGANQFIRRKTIRDTCTENCKEKISQEVCPYERKELCLIFSLSKIANIQVANPRRIATDRGLRSKISGDMHKHAENVHVEKSNGSGQSPFALGEHFEAGGSMNSSWDDNKSPNVPCRAIRDVYIPEVNKKLPAVACKFQNRTFILSSARFLQDRRSRLNINVDANTFNNIKSVPKISRSSEFNVIPALLVLKLGDNNYRIQMHENVSNERKVNHDKGGR